MNKRKFQLYGDFQKVERLEDGTVKVAGIVSSETVDGAGETVLASAMKAAIPDYMAFGAVREMHQPIAAGSALSIETGEDGITRFECLVVDEGSIKKVLSDPPVLKGFSIGGKVTARDESDDKIITGLKLNEISLVDRPCNPDAKFAVAKLEGDQPTLGELRKGMWAVQDFTGVLASIGWMAQDAAAEAEWEGDASPVPAALRDWLAEGAEILQAMAKEELDELLATLPKAPGSDVLEMAQKLAKGEMPLQKSGAKFSQASKDALADIHKCLKDADSKMGALGYDKEEEEEEDPKGDAEKLAKLEGEKGDALARAEHLEGDLKKAQDEADTLRKQIEKLKKQPEKPVGVKTVVVSKAEDTLDPGAESLQKQAEAIEALPEDQRPAALIKFIHSHRQS